jgi:hypothetical protein
MCPNVFDNREYSFFVNNVTDTTFLDEFSCHRGEYVVVGVHRVKAPSPENLPSIMSATSIFLPISRKQVRCVVPS